MLFRAGVMVMVFSATFNNISAISWRSILLVEKTENQEKTTDMPLVRHNSITIMTKKNTCCVN